MSCWTRGFDKAIRSIAMLLADDAQRKNEIQPPFRLSLDDSRGGGSGEVEIDKRLVDCVHTIDDVFGVEADCEILAFETDGDFFVDFAVVGVSVEGERVFFDLHLDVGFFLCAVDERDAVDCVFKHFFCQR